MITRTALILALIAAPAIAQAKPADSKFYQAAKNKTAVEKKYEVAGSKKDIKDPNELSKLAPAAGSAEEKNKGLNPRQFKMQ